eukprot:240107-Hanusia_phi.AAC.1
MRPCMRPGSRPPMVCIMTTSILWIAGASILTERREPCREMLPNCMPGEYSRHVLLRPSLKAAERVRVSVAADGVVQTSCCFPVRATPVKAWWASVSESKRVVLRVSNVAPDMGGGGLKMIGCRLWTRPSRPPPGAFHWPANMRGWGLLNRTGAAPELAPSLRGGSGR